MKFQVEWYDYSEARRDARHTRVFLHHDNALEFTRQLRTSGIIEIEIWEVS